MEQLSDSSFEENEINMINESEKADDDKGYSLKLPQSLYRTPRPRQQWIDGKFVKSQDKVEEAWVELFIDLVYVVLIYKLGEMAMVCFDLARVVFGRVLLIFWSLCLTRMSIDEYANRFYSHDLLHKLLYLFYTGGVFVQVMNINAKSNPVDDSSACVDVYAYTVGILGGFLLTRVSLIIIHLLVMFHYPKAKEQFIFDIYRWTTSCVLIICVLISTENQAIMYYVLLALVVQETLAWLLSRSLFRQRYTFPVDLELLQARWGIWIMIVIGEAIIQLLVPPLQTNSLSKGYAINLLALLLMFSLAMQYYDACQREWFEHALTKSATSGIVWIWLHPIVSFFLFGIGVSLKMINHDDNANAATAILLPLCCGIVSVCLTFMRLSHINFSPKSKMDILLYTARFILAFFQITLISFGPTDSPVKMLLFETLLSVIGFNFLDMFYEVAGEIFPNAVSIKSTTKSSRPFHQLNLTKFIDTPLSIQQDSSRQSLSIRPIYDIAQSQKHETFQKKSWGDDQDFLKQTQDLMSPYSMFRIDSTTNVSNKKRFFAGKQIKPLSAVSEIDENSNVNGNYRLRLNAEEATSTVANDVKVDPNPVSTEACIDTEQEVANMHIQRKYSSLPRLNTDLNDNV